MNKSRPDNNTFYTYNIAQPCIKCKKLEFLLHEFKYCCYCFSCKEVGKRRQLDGLWRFIELIKYDLLKIW